MTKNIQMDGHTVKSTQGLRAPPYIDMVWISLLKYKSYSKFCKEMLGIYLERPVGDESEESFYSYRQTLNYLGKFVSCYSYRLPQRRVIPLYELVAKILIRVL